MISEKILLQKGWIGIFLSVSLLLLAGCSQAGLQASPDWKPADVRTLDAVDSRDPKVELLALYTRDLEKERQVRLDFLQIPLPFPADIVLEIDHAPGGMDDPAAPGGQRWDLRIEIPSQGAIRLERSGQAAGEGGQGLRGVPLRVVRNPQAGSIEIHLLKDGLGNFAPDASLQACTVEPASGVKLDCTEPARWNGKMPERLPVLLAFNHAYPAYSASQALRRWDGAHSGPQGGRHGLYNLLRVTRSHQAQIVLLDLLSPESLSALDYLGGVGLVEAMQEDGLLILANPLPETPEPLPGWAVDRLLAENQQAAEQVGLTASPLLFKPIFDIPGKKLPSVRMQFSTGEEAFLVMDSLAYENGRLVIQAPATSGWGAPTSAYEHPQAILAWPALAWKESLARLAWQINQPGADLPPRGDLPPRRRPSAQARSSAPLLILGGSLPESPWGNPENARAMVRYLEQHPWIRLASASDLQAGRQVVYFSSPGHPSVAGENLNPGELLSDLRQAPDNILSQAAWQAYRAAYLPVFPRPAELMRLRQGYLGEAARLLSAARWADQPASQASCESDTDGDHLPECLLANSTVRAEFELDSGRLASLFFRCTSGIHQAVGSSAQLISGLGDPLDWQESSLPSTGRLTDPGVYDGALAGPGGTHAYFFEGGRLVMTSADGMTTKSFELTDLGMRIEIRAQNRGEEPASPGRPGRMVFPLLLDPWQRFQPGGGSRSSLEEYQLLSPGGLVTQTSGAGGTHELTWRLNRIEQEPVSISLGFNGAYSVRSFLSSKPTLGQPENPNFAYPAGHYDPFPLAVIEFDPRDTLVIEVVFSCGGELQGGSAE